MKKIIIALLLLPFISFSQGDFRVEKVTDEFTGEVTIQSNWLKLNDPTWVSGHIAFIKINRLEKFFVLELKVTTGTDILAINKDNKFYIKLSNDKIITLFNINYTISAMSEGAIGFRGSKATGVHLYFRLTFDELKALSENDIYKCSLETSEGRMDIVPEKKKFKTKIREGFDLFYRLIENEKRQKSERVLKEMN